MENLIFISTILGIHILGWLTPGPLFVLILRNSLVYSRKAGVWTAMGIAIGNFIHISYSVIGITLLIPTSATAFIVIRFLGVSYLAYLGLKTIFIKVEAQKENTQLRDKDISAYEAIKTGFLTNILSPKSSLFFASVFAAVLSSNPPYWVVIFLMITLPINSFVMASILSIFFTQKKVKYAYSKYQDVVNKCLGAALIVLAVMIALHNW